MDGRKLRTGGRAKAGRRNRRTAAGLFLAAMLILAACDDFMFFPSLDGTPVIDPSTASIHPNATAVFEISGGSPPYRVTFSGAGSLSLDGTRVEYTAGPEKGSATIRVTDRLGSRAEAVVLVSP